jgi:hypothetical protein
LPSISATDSSVSSLPSYLGPSRTAAAPAKRWNAVSYSCHYGLFAAVSFVDLFSGDSKNFCAFDYELTGRRSQKMAPALITASRICNSLSSARAQQQAKRLKPLDDIFDFCTRLKPLSLPTSFLRMNKLSCKPLFINRLRRKLFWEYSPKILTPLENSRGTFRAKNILFLILLKFSSDSRNSDPTGEKIWVMTSR